MRGLTIDEAIRALTLVREQVGGDAPLVWCNGQGVRLVADAKRRCVVASDAGPGLDDLEPARPLGAG
jgi:hypothetical protein